jgi:hypothetical protein
MLLIGRFRDGIKAMAATRSTLIWRLTVCAIIFAAAAHIRATAAAISGAVVTTLSDAERDFDLRGASLSVNGALADLIIAAHPKGRPNESESFIWATVDASGRILSQRDPLASMSTANAAALNLQNPVAGSAFVFSGTRGFLLLPAMDGSVRLLRLTRPNNQVVVRTINIGGRAPIIRRVLETNGGHVVFAGSLGAEGIIAEFDIEGKTISEHRLGEGGTTAINVISESDGNLVTVAEEGAFPNSSTSVERISPRGNVLAKTSFPGRPSDLARGSDGTYVVLIEKAGADGSEILIKALGTDLTERWTRSLVARQRLVPPFRVAPVQSGGFIVAGTKDRGLWISRLNSDGKEVWTDTHDPLTSPELEMVSHVELVAAQDVFVAAYTAFVVSGREQRTVVRTLRFTAS